MQLKWKEGKEMVCRLEEEREGDGMQNVDGRKKGKEMVCRMQMEGRKGRR